LCPYRFANVEGVAAEQLDDLAGAHHRRGRQVAVEAVVQYPAETVEDLRAFRCGDHVR
jgi:hypothetical protein